jgi:hypothetical protein
MDISSELLRTTYDCKLLASSPSLRAATQVDGAAGSDSPEDVGIMLQPKRPVKMQDFAYLPAFPQSRLRQLLPEFAAWGPAHTAPAFRCITTIEAAPPVAPFDRWVPGMMVSGALSDGPTFMRQCQRDATKLDAYTDTRDLQRELKTQGVQLTIEADEKSKGAGVFCHHGP